MFGLHGRNFNMILARDICWALIDQKVKQLMSKHTTWPIFSLWCRAFTKVSINCSGNVLRGVLSLRKSQDMDLQADVDMLEAEIRI